MGRSGWSARLLAVSLASALSLGACSAGSWGASTATLGEPAPAIVATTLDGEPLDLANLRGSPAIVNFWASWCGPCRDEFPVLQEGLDSHAADGLAIVGVVYKDLPAAAASFMDDFGATWESVTDPDGAIATSYRVVAPPQTYFIDGDGVLRSIHIGEVTAEDFESEYAKIAP